MNKPIDIEEQKEIMLSMMDNIDSFCRNNGIKYFLYGGSLIGAVRHGGYIPWDDDIDICMLRDDYDRFLSSYNDSKGRYLLIHPGNNKNYYLPTAKVYDDYTILDEKIPGGMKIGIYIDIFPLDYSYDDYDMACRYGNKIGFFRKIIRIKNVPILQNRRFYKNAILYALKLLVSFIPKRYAIDRVCMLSSAFRGKKSKYVGQFTQMTYESKEIYETDWFNEAIDHDFEGREYCIPVLYDDVLKKEFGDYMTLPPKEKQIPHHGNNTWWK